MYMSLEDFARFMRMEWLCNDDPVIEYIYFSLPEIIVRWGETKRVNVHQLIVNLWVEYKELQGFTKYKEGYLDGWLIR